MGTILMLLGAVLLILGVLSGITLFIKAVTDSLRDSNSGVGFIYSVHSRWNNNIDKYSLMVFPQLSRPEQEVNISSLGMVKII